MMWDLEYELKWMVCADSLIFSEAINFVELFMKLSAMWGKVDYR